MRRAAFLLVLLALGLVTHPAAAEQAPPAWPVRLNVSMPFGNTFGREEMHGFTWGFRPALIAYPSHAGHGPGLGFFGEYLIDAKTHAMWSLGGLGSVPVASFDIFDLRIGGLVAQRGSAEGNDDARRLLLGALTELTVPAYLYDFRVGLRFDGTFDDEGVSATSLLLEVDVVAVLGLVMYGASGAR